MVEEIIPPNRNIKPTNGNSDRFLNIGQFHYHENDLRELAKLAEIDPKLASKIVDQRDHEDARANTSFRFGLIVATLLVAIIIFAFSWLLIKVGVAGTLIAIGAVLAVSLLVRVILTGQWSETTWFGKMVAMLARALGATNISDDSTP